MTQALAVAGDIGAGHVLGRYELLLPIASGGMAMVWAARLKGTRGFQKIVAVKTMLPKLSEDEQFEQMFLDEASLASQIRHPHVVEILDLGEQDGVLFLVMEWIDGVPVNQLMKAAKKHGGIPVAVATRVVMQACAGLHAAHELKDAQGRLVGLVHRDVSPQNILVTYDGVTKVVDFGVAKATALNDGMTATGQIKGKVAYMAPEQVRGGAIDRRADVFAMGIVLYAVTTGKHPFRRETEAATMYNIASPSPVVPPRTIIPDYPPQIEAIVLKALAKDPDRRYATANELLRALDGLPPALRASTDEDTGQFVRNLLSEKREERRAALSKALAAADRQAESRVSLRELMNEPGGSATTLTPVTSRQSSPDGSGPLQHITLSGQSNAALSGITGVALDPALKRRRWILGGVAAAGVLALGAVIAAAAGEEPELKARPPVVAAPAPVDSAPAALEPPPAPIPEPEPEPVLEPPVEAAVTASAKPTPPPPPQPAVSPRVRKPRKSAPDAAASSKPNWRHNPGF